MATAKLPIVWTGVYTYLVKNQSEENLSSLIMRKYIAESD